MLTITVEGGALTRPFTLNVPEKTVTVAPLPNPGYALINDSSVISSVWYNGTNKALEIEFLSGARYKYANVPLGIVMCLLTSFSKGAYYNSVIKGRFTGTRLDT